MKSLMWVIIPLFLANSFGQTTPKHVWTNEDVVTAPKNSIAQSALQISFPGKAWALQFEGTGFSVKANETQPDGRRYLLAENTANGMMLSAFLEQVPGTADMDGCQKGLRDKLATFSSLRPTDVQNGRMGDIVTLEYILLEVSGIPVHQKNVWGCLAKDNVYADIHLSKAPFNPKDQPLFDSLLGSAHITTEVITEKTNSQISSSSKSSKDYLTEGSKFYVAGQFANAIGPYQKALDLEKEDRKLDLSLWRVLLDNLAMAYGITGNLDSAEEVARYGITKDPEYPLFYFILADTYAERGDMDNTMKFLTTAFQYKQNVIPGEAMPDPRTDDSFKRFLSNDRFRKFLDSLGK